MYREASFNIYSQALFLKCSTARLWRRRFRYPPSPSIPDGGCNERD